MAGAAAPVPRVKPAWRPFVGPLSDSAVLTAIAAMIGAAVILADPIFQGLAISLLFGLASSTLLTVLVIPAIYIALRYRPAVGPVTVGLGHLLGRDLERVQWIAAAESALRAAKSAGRNRSMSAPAFGSLGP